VWGGLWFGGLGHLGLDDELHALDGSSAGLGDGAGDATGKEIGKERTTLEERDGRQG